jgi:hypothetical protein
MGDNPRCPRVSFDNRPSLVLPPFDHVVRWSLRESNLPPDVVPGLQGRLFADEVSIGTALVVSSRNFGESVLISLGQTTV